MTHCDRGLEEDAADEPEDRDVDVRPLISVEVIRSLTGNDEVGGGKDGAAEVHTSARHADLTRVAPRQ